MIMGSESGSAYLFDVTDPTDPVELAKLTALDVEANDRFGISVAISGNTVVIGARWDDDLGANSGSAYLFDISDPQQPDRVDQTPRTRGSRV